MTRQLAKPQHHNRASREAAKHSQHITSTSPPPSHLTPRSRQALAAVESRERGLKRARFNTGAMATSKGKHWRQRHARGKAHPHPRWKTTLTGQPGNTLLCACLVTTPLLVGGLVAAVYLSGAVGQHDRSGGGGTTLAPRPTQQSRHTQTATGARAGAPPASTGSGTPLTGERQLVTSTSTQTVGFGSIITAATAANSTAATAPAAMRAAATSNDSTAAATTAVASAAASTNRPSSPATETQAHTKTGTTASATPSTAAIGRTKTTAFPRGTTTTASAGNMMVPTTERASKAANHAYIAGAVGGCTLVVCVMAALLTCRRRKSVHEDRMRHNVEAGNPPATPPPYAEAHTDAATVPVYEMTNSIAAAAPLYEVTENSRDSSTFKAITNAGASQAQDIVRDGNSFADVYSDPNEECATPPQRQHTCSPHEHQHQHQHQHHQGHVVQDSVARVARERDVPAPKRGGASTQATTTQNHVHQDAFAAPSTVNRYYTDTRIHAWGRSQSGTTKAVVSGADRLMRGAGVPLRTPAKTWNARKPLLHLGACLGSHREGEPTTRCNVNFGAKPGVSSLGVTVTDPIGAKPGVSSLGVTVKDPISAKPGVSGLEVDYARVQCSAAFIPHHGACLHQGVDDPVANAADITEAVLYANAAASTNHPCMRHERTTASACSSATHASSMQGLLTYQRIPCQATTKPVMKPTAPTPRPPKPRPRPRPRSLTVARSYRCHRLPQHRQTRAALVQPCVAVG